LYYETGYCHNNTSRSSGCSRSGAKVS